MERHKKGSSNIIFTNEKICKLKTFFRLFNIKLNGIIYDEFPKGELKEEVYFINGLLDKIKIYYQNGKLKSEGEGLFLTSYGGCHSSFCLIRGSKSGVNCSLKD